MKQVIQIFSFFLSFLIINSSTIAQGSTSAQPLSDFSFNTENAAAPGTIFSTMSEEEVLKIKIETDLDNLMLNKYKDDYQEATLSYESVEGIKTHAIKLKPRGKFRRKTCDFPPLKIKFKKGGLEEKGISTSYKTLKLVTHCMYDENAEQTLLKEYVAYKMYNQLTEASFKVKLVEVTYVNSAKDTLDEVKYGFIIENTNELADRLDGLENEKSYNLNLDSISKEYSHMIPMFQYMIANMDWRPHMLQNIKVIDKNSGERIMVPYDFDFSGLVNAPYAIPSVDFKQQNIKDRIYMHKVDNLNELEPTIRYFQKHKKEILEAIKSCEKLSKKNRRKMTNYIHAFYETLNSPTLSKQAFVK